MSNVKLKLGKYLRKKAALRPLRKTVEADAQCCRRAVIIPAMAEAEFLPRTLASLGANPGAIQRDTAVVVVVNQPETDPPPPSVPGSMPNTETVADSNRSTLDWLERHYGEFEFRLNWIDAASAGHRLAGRGGVGMARRVGCDSLLRVLYGTPTVTAPSRNPPEKFVFMHLDADTEVAADYLHAASDGLLAAGTDGGVVDFKHQKAADPKIQAAIEAYERYLFYVRDSLKAAGSPYAFHTVGSAMVCTAAGYVKAGGVPVKRQAGEDFYFLQQLAKNGGVCEINKTRVFPSPRISARTPYGTGPSVREIIDQGIENYTVYSPQCFEALTQWLDTVTANIDRPAAEILLQIDNAEVRNFVERKGFETAWSRISAQHPAPAARLKAFHEWFDALASMRLVRHLSRTVYAPVPLASSKRAFQRPDSSAR